MEFTKPTIRKMKGHSVWRCFIPGHRSGVGAGPTPTRAYLEWLKVITHNVKNAF